MIAAVMSVQGRRFLTRMQEKASSYSPGRAAAASGQDGRRMLESFGLLKGARKTGSPLALAVEECRRALAGVWAISGVLNLLALASSFYMLQVYDRVLPSRSIPTLIGLTLLILLLYAFQGFFDVVRGRLLLRISTRLDEVAHARVFRATLAMAVQGDGDADGLRPMRDLDQLRTFMAGVGPAALFDLPWIPLYLGLCFLFHPLIGATALAGSLALVGLTILTERLTRGPTRDATEAAGARIWVAETARRNAETVRAMGMGPEIEALWDRANAEYRRSQERAAEVTGGLGSLSRVFRVALQSCVLGVGAYLVVNDMATGGIIIASSILTSRSLAPVDAAISHWKSFVSARQSWARLEAIFEKAPEGGATMSLPAPKESLRVEFASAAPPGTQRITAYDVDFTLRPGAGLGVIGKSASGKSSLARLIVGVWRPVRGHVRLDGSSLDHWRPEELGRHIGYLPQEVELFAGTVAANIARFRPDAKADKIIEAAKAANVHELIQQMPKGYQTQIGERGAVLSAGQRQRVALARALYDDPFLVVLDEPNSNLDGEGEQALTDALVGVRKRGGIVVVVAHRPSALAALDQVLVMNDGRVQAFGSKDEVLGTSLKAVPGHAPNKTLKTA
jgi:PrtD family type I secretion system ABC transporter